MTGPGERDAPLFLQQEHWETLRREQQAAPPAVTWRWHDHWHQAHPPGWDGRHEITVRGHWQNCDAAGVTLACSCGREADAAMPPAYGTDGEISLAGLNAIALAHQKATAPPAGQEGAR